MTRKPRLFIAACALALALGGGPARAQWVVIDPANLAQSITQVTHMISQINNQIEQIRQQAQMLESLGLELSPELSASIGQVRNLLREAEGLQQNAETIASDMRSLYPEDVSSFDLDRLLGQSDRWLEESRHSVEALMTISASASSDGLEDADSAMSRALQASANAAGPTSAEQATAQAIGVLSSQVAQLQALQAAQARALATERIEQIAREERAREMRRRAFPTEASSDAPPAQPRF
jgi:P-type conjugative transfer protein TrbJ